MEKRSIESLFQSLNEHKVRYLVVGGLAVVAHGYVRFTADVDLVLALDEENILQAITALETLGYRPRAPVAFAEFADPAARQRWIDEKGLTVFSLFSPAHPTTEVDLFVESPLDFALAMGRAARRPVAAGVEAAFCGLEDLLELKRRAGRPRDLDDIRQLTAIRQGTSDG
jgi:predicted nucleotidyltransferase